MLTVVAVVISSSSQSSDVNVHTAKETASGPVRPRTTHLTIDAGSSPLLPLDEYNVGLVLEKLLAMMQSMSMLLSALKNDLRHSSVPDVVAKKRDAATTQLWRAFMTYQKSFSEIEQFASTSRSSGLATKKSANDPVRSQPQSRVSQAAPVKTSRRSRSSRVQEADVIELSESESEEDVRCKRLRRDETETVKQSAETVASSATFELAINPTLIASSSDSSLAPSALASNLAVDELSDTSASCVCVEPASESPLTSDVDACKSDLPESLDSEPLFRAE